MGTPMNIPVCSPEFSPLVRAILFQRLQGHDMELLAETEVAIAELLPEA
jgi:hypothetical protein